MQDVQPLRADTYITGDLLQELPKYAGEDLTCVILQQVNAQGVMGSGFAKAIRDKWPAVWKTYSAAVTPNQPDKGQRYLGLVIWTQIEQHIYVASIVGQQFYGHDHVRYTSYDALDTGLKEVRGFIDQLDGIVEVHYPLIGCGLGGGNWSIVSTIIDAHFDKIPHTLWIPPDFEKLLKDKVVPE